MIRTAENIGTVRPGWRMALLGAAAVLPLLGTPTQARQDDGSTLRLLTLNIWNRFKQAPAGPAEFMAAGNYDALMFQEANGSKYVSDIPGILASKGLGTYQGALAGSSGIISRLPGSVGSYTLPGIGTQGRNITYSVADAADGRPTTVIGSIHLDYSDQSTSRVAEAKALNTWAKQQTGPLIIAGDFNAGDVSERGLHSISQQELLLRIYTKNPNNSFYYKLLTQYAQDQAQLDSFIQTWRGKGNTAINNAAIPTGLFKPETLPVADNTPVTLNVLKKQFMMLQVDSEREGFAPHELGDGSGTWPSVGEDATNTWGSWNRDQIDHFIASRPFGKWYAVTDDAADPYLGIIDNVYVTMPDGSRQPLSDHEPVAHEFTWVGPQLEAYTRTVDGKTVASTRLVWGEDASSFGENGGTFNLSRNNMRTDVYLGQISDQDGIPTLGWLTDDEKKMQLDCGTSDSRLAASVTEYCIDDHSFIGETLVQDGGTVVVTEDAALGAASADLRLTDNATLRIAGTQMDSLGRQVSLEGAGGAIDVADATANVAATQVISGDGALIKRGEGTLSLNAENTYTGETRVEAGTLLVNGSTAASSLTTVNAGATLGGTGHVGDVFLGENSILSPGGMGIGTLFIDGDLMLDHALMNFEIGADGFDMLNIAGNFNALSDFTISFSFLDGFMPEQGSFLEFLNVGGTYDSFMGFVTLLLPEDPAYAGLSIFSNNNGRFALSWENPYDIPSVPLPAPVLALASALGLFGAVGARRKRNATPKQPQ